LRQLCTDNGIPLIFDEVMTGFRLAAGGVQERLSYSDIVCFGKVIGGGLQGSICSTCRNYELSYVLLQAELCLEIHWLWLQD
jgi:glutamate-1-semialdehyde aminotransferase